MIKNANKLLARISFCVATIIPNLAEAWTPGTYPAAPMRMHSGGFSVDNHNRNDVVAFWQAVYQASEGYETRIGWNGNYSGNSGTVSSAFVGDVERRINYFRAMCGLNSSTTVSANSTVVIDPLDPIKPAPSTLKSAAAQNAALMLVRNYNPRTGQNPALTHYPASNLIGWSPMAWNATSKGNFAFGLYGPGAITEYMVEQLSASAATSSWNTLVGHRRWNLYPNATVFATGDQPGASAYLPPTNVFYVLQKEGELLDGPDPGFVAYPAAGFFPAPINSPYWSLSRKGANFTAAMVKMTDASGNNVAISSIQRSMDYGDPAIIWKVPDSVASRSVVGDTTYHVKVSGILGDGIPATYNYSVTLINPDLLTSNQKISGKKSLTAKGSEIYTFTPPAGAESLQMVAYRRNSKGWKENAETPGKAKVIDHTESNYSLMVNPTSFAGFGPVSGKNSFHLTFPHSYDLLKRTVPDQSFELDRDIVANKKAKLTFLYRRGFMTPASSLIVEMSNNGGVTWKALGSPIKGVSNTQYDLSLSSTSRPLPKSATPIRIRFRYYTTGGAIYTHEAAPQSPTGIFIDEIKTTRCDWLEQKKATNLSPSAGRYVFNSKSAGAKLIKGAQWQLRMRARLGGKWFPPGPVKPVKVK